MNGINKNRGNGDLLRPPTGDHATSFLGKGTSKIGLP